MERLLEIRSSSRNWLTRTSKVLEELTQKESVTLVQLENALAEFDKRLNNVDDIQGNIELDIPDDLLDETVAEAFSFRQCHMNIKIKAEQRLFDIRNVKADTDACSIGKQSCLARLPQLEIPKFSGNYLEFYSFYEKFCAAVDESDLPPVTKFRYLQSLLTGEALASISGLSGTAESYNTAKYILKQRFGRKQRIISSHIQKLLAIQVDCGKSNGLWDLYGALQKHVRYLEALGVADDRYSVILTAIIVSKMPSEIQMEWAREGDGRESDLVFLLDFLCTQIKRSERSQSLETQDDQRKPKHITEPSVASFHSNSQSKECCGFCKKQHKSEQCYSIKGINASDLCNKVNQNGLCFLCFGNHYLSDCSSKQTCRKCNKRHNTLLCQKLTLSTNGENDRPTICKETDQSNVHYANTKDRRALINVVNHDIESQFGHKDKVNVLFDGGSDRSHITKGLAQKLKPSCGKERCSYAGVGGTCFDPRTKRNIYPLGDVSVELAEIDTICAKMYCAPKECDVAFIGDYSKGRDKEVSNWIGLDRYSYLVSCEMKNVGSLVAQKTACGWLLSGEYAGLRNPQNVQLLCFEPVSESLKQSFWKLDTVGIKIGYREMDNNTVTEGFELNQELDGNPKLMFRCYETIREIRDTGLISDVSAEDERICGAVFCKPNSPVLKDESTTTNVRLDTPANGFNGISLDDCVKTGPDLLPNVFGIFLWFRRWNVAETTDVSKALKQVQGYKDVNDLCWGRVRQNVVYDRGPFDEKLVMFLCFVLSSLHYADDLRLHILCDAFAKAYQSCAYLVERQGLRH